MLLEQKASMMGATVLPSSVRPCSSNALSHHEDTAVSKTPKPWHPEWTFDEVVVKQNGHFSV